MDRCRTVAETPPPPGSAIISEIEGNPWTCDGPWEKHSHGHALVHGRDTALDLRWSNAEIPFSGAPSGTPENGGSASESNRPTTLFAPYLGFEAQEAHQVPVRSHGTRNHASRRSGVQGALRGPSRLPRSACARGGLPPSLGTVGYPVPPRGSRAPGSRFPQDEEAPVVRTCLLYTSPSPRDLSTSRMPSSA